MPRVGLEPTSGRSHFVSLTERPPWTAKISTTNLYLSILLHYVTYNVTVSVSMQHNIYYIIFLLSFSLTTSTCFGLTWPTSGVDYCAKLSHCTLYCIRTTILATGNQHIHSSQYRPVRELGVFLAILVAGRSEWPRDLRHELSTLARTLGSWVQIPLEEWMSACLYSVSVMFRV
jgi:hypothetical protein